MYDDTAWADKETLNDIKQFINEYKLNNCFLRRNTLAPWDELWSVLQPSGIITRYPESYYSKWVPFNIFKVNPLVGKGLTSYRT